MSNLPSLLQSVGTYMSSRIEDVAGSSSGVSQQSGHASGVTQAINYRYDKVHLDVRPYVMMTKTCYMEYDPVKNRGVILGIYARAIGSVIWRIVVFQDVKLNQIQLAVERTKTKKNFSHGWTRLHDFYKIGSGAWLTLLFINPFLFHVKVRTIDGIEITYPDNSPPHQLLLDKDFQTSSWDGPIPYFVMPKNYFHVLEKTLTSADASSGILTLYWRGFCQSALPNESTQLTLIEWLGNTWQDCRFELDGSPSTICKISGQWNDICKIHRLAAGVVVKFGVTEASNNKIMYFKLAPFLGIHTTLYAPSTQGDKKFFYQNQYHFML